MEQSMYELSSDYNGLMEYADSIDPDDEQVFLDTLEAVLGAIDLKMDDYAVVMSHMKEREDLIDNEIKRLEARKDAIKNNRTRMNERLYEVMTTTDRRKVTTDLHTFSIRKNGGKLPLVITGDVPDNFQKVIYEPDNERIREALDNGEALDFAHYGERGEYLKID